MEKTEKALGREWLKLVARRRRKGRNRKRRTHGKRKQISRRKEERIEQMEG